MSIGGSFGKLVLFGAVGGVLVALAAYPGIFTIGRSADTASDSYLALPASLETPPTYQTSYVYANDNKTLITSFYEENRRDVTLSQVSEAMQQTVVAAEDVRFFQHGGVDYKAIIRALVADQQSGQTTQGASTLTMQYVRNVLKTDPSLTPEERAAAVEDSIGRKIQEARYSIELEQKLTKQQILERYMNIAYFGQGAYGVFAAAQTYFSTTPDKLTLAQASLLSGIIQSPDTYNPVNGDVAAARTRQKYVLTAMVGMKEITQAQADEVAKAPLGLKPKHQPNDCTEVPSKTNSWGFFCDYFLKWWDDQAAFGVTSEDREANLRQGGYRIVTTLDPSIQATATKESLALYGYDNKRTLPIAVVQPGTGRVLALTVNRHYSLTKNPKGQTDYPNTVNQLIAGGGSVIGFQTGSTFKIFTMLAALERGLPLNTKFKAPAKLKTHFPAHGPGTCNGYYCPANANPKWMDGQRTMWTGYGRSVNTYFVWLEQQIGPEYAVAMAERLGIRFNAAHDRDLADHGADSWGPFTLGVVATTPLELVNAYATVAAGGIYCKPLPVSSIKTPSGQALSVATPQCKRVVSKDIAAAAADAARCPVQSKSYYDQCNGGTAPVAPLILGSRPLGGKTGSSEKNATETFVGFTPQIAACGIAGNPVDPSDLVGASVSHDVDVAVLNTMKTALKGLPYVNFPQPSAEIAFGPKGVPSSLAKRLGLNN